MATGTGNLPYPGKVYNPFDILTAEELNEDVANIESLADGSGRGDGSISTSQYADASVTPSKLTSDNYFYANRTTSLTTAASSITKFPFNNEVRDPSGTYDPTTNYRWTPGVAGIYLITANVLWSGTSPTRSWLSIRVNGNEIVRSGDIQGTTNGSISPASATWLGHLSNTDYVEVFYFTNTATNIATTGQCNFSGVLQLKVS